MYKYVLALAWLFYIISSYAESIFCGISNSQVECLESYINKQQAKEISIPYGVYFLTRALVIPANTNLNGNGAVLIPTFNNMFSAAILINGASNINIRDITIRGNGVFKTGSLESTPNNICGFNLFTNGIQVVNSKNINISNMRISGLYNGIVVMGNDVDTLSENITLDNNVISNSGRSAITAVFVNKIVILRNRITGVLGNQVPCLVNWINNSKFADGIYLDSVRSTLVEENYISDVKRIGIVVEGRLNQDHKIAFVNKNISIIKNIVLNMNSCRGTENNAGVWVEPCRSSPGNTCKINKTIDVRIESNYISNINATSCNLFQYGVLSGADNSMIRDNTISHFQNESKYKGVGIRCAVGNCEIVNNRFINNDVGVKVNSAFATVGNINDRNLFIDNLESIVYVK